MDEEMATFYLSGYCDLVKGANGSAIYDFKGKQVYSLDATETAILHDLLCGKYKSSHKSFYERLKAEGFITNEYSAPFKPLEIIPQLEYAWLELTGNCNCSCLHCYGAFGAVKNNELIEELSADEWEAVLQKIKSLGCTAIQFIGGEPVLHSAFTRLVEYAYNIGICDIDIFTNGTLLTEEHLRLFIKVSASVRVSLYGYDSLTHDLITQQQGSFARLDATLRLLKKHEVPTTISVIIMKENQHIVEEIADYITRIGHKYSGYDIARPVTGVSQKYNAVTNNKVARERYIESPSFKTTYRKYCINRKWNSCWYGKAAITSQGDVIPCIFARSMLCGNIRHDNIILIKEKLLEFWSFTKDKVAVCKNCEYRYACDDCRPLSYDTTGELLSKYPRCLYVPCLAKWDTLK